MRRSPNVGRYGIRWACRPGRRVPAANARRRNGSRSADALSRSLMRLTTIGTGTVSPSPSRVCAGHLVNAGSVNILLDCGSGVVHGLAKARVNWMEITHVAITHFHADHLSDLAFLIFTWRHGAERPREAPIEIIGPVGTDSLISRFADAFGPWVRDP